MLLSVEQVAELAGVSRKTIYRWLELEGEAAMPRPVAQEPAKAIRWEAAEIAAWLDTRMPRVDGAEGSPRKELMQLLEHDTAANEANARAEAGRGWGEDGDLMALGLGVGEQAAKLRRLSREAAEAAAKQTDHSKELAEAAASLVHVEEHLARLRRKLAGEPQAQKHWVGLPSPAEYPKPLPEEQERSGEDA